MTRRIEKLLKKKVGDGGGESPLGLTLVDADARARTCSFAYATSSFVQASVQHARGDAFFAALRACDASVTPAVRDAADQAHAILLAAIERVEARRAKKKAEREAAEAAAIRAKMTPRSVKLRRRREEAPREPSHDADPSPKPSSDKAIASDGSNPDRTRATAPALQLTRAHVPAAADHRDFAPCPWYDTLQRERGNVPLSQLNEEIEKLYN